jgi:hypothetical protein
MKTPLNNGQISLHWAGYCDRWRNFNHFHSDIDYCIYHISSIIFSQEQEMK